MTQAKRKGPSQNPCFLHQAMLPRGQCDAALLWQISISCSVFLWLFSMNRQENKSHKSIITIWYLKDSSNNTKIGRRKGTMVQQWTQYGILLEVFRL